MDLNRLYEKAFAFKALKLWEKLEDDQIFAVRVGDRDCYINIMGKLGEHYALAVYPDREGMDGLWRIYQAADGEETEILAAGLGQDSIHCEFAARDELEEDAMEQLKAYAKSHGISMRGKQGIWPQFMRYRPYREPKLVTSEEDAEILEEALDGALWLAGQRREEICLLAHMDEEGETIPLLCRDGDTWRAEEMPMPAEPEASFPVGDTPNEMYKARTRKLKKKGTWTCGLMLMPTLSAAEGMDEKVYPWNLLTLNIPEKTGIEVQGVRDYETRTDVMLDKLMEAMFRENVCPKSIEVSDERTYALLSDFCTEMKIQLVMLDEKPEVMEDLEEQILVQSNPERVVSVMEDMLDFVLSIPDEHLYDDPAQAAMYREVFEEMLTQPDLPEGIRFRVTALLERLRREPAKRSAKSGKKKQTRGKKKKVQGKTLVISVSLETGCYRHIQISDQALLEELSDEILKAFEFDNDHMHAFFMDNRAFSMWDAYYMRGGEESDERFTDETTLADTGVQVGQKFKYIFDFGDEWIFQCRVLKQLDEITEEPRIIRAKGTPPQQYPEWDDEDDWEGGDVCEDEDDDWDEDE